MKRRTFMLVLAAAAAALGAGLWLQAPAPVEPTVLSFRVGQRFEDVVKASTYPVLQHSNVPSAEIGMAGDTFVTEPAVILCFNDSQHGFVLPPTKFAFVGYEHDMVVTVATSPTLDKMSFDEAVAVLDNLQNQFKAGGWEPWAKDGSAWFDLTPQGRQRLFRRMFEPGYSQSAELRIPKKYGMTFRLKCTDGCWPGEAPPYRFLVDVGISDDTYERNLDDPEVWDRSYAGAVPSSAPARFTCPDVQRRAAVPKAGT
jgi:hypothetical protein